jgi:hypothetical protein
VKRFQRSEVAPPMQVTERDLRLLAHVSRHRFVSSDQLAALDGGSAQGVLRCLRTLYDNGYLDRPKAQLAVLHSTGPKPMVYGLGQRGARALREHGHLINDGVDWVEKNKRAGAVFIEHTLRVAEFMTQIELACARDTAVELMREDEIIALAPEKTRTSREPLRWSVKGLDEGGGVASVVPDGLFGLLFPDDSAAYFMLEIDRGTIPIVRNSKDHRSITRKLATYYHGWRTERHDEQFGVKQVRVLTVTNSAVRVENMVSAVRDITEGRGSNFFLFIDHRTLMAGDPLQAKWVSGKGERVRLGD